MSLTMTVLVEDNEKTIHTHTVISLEFSNSMFYVVLERDFNGILSI